MSKFIFLTKGQKTIVDDDTYEWANKFKWYAMGIRDQYYVCRKSRGDEVLKGEKRKVVLLGRQIMNTPVGMTVDHINNNPLDNRRINLRNCTFSQNLVNRRYYGNKTAKQRGAYKMRGVFLALISINGKGVYLGYFKTEAEAHNAYVKAARELYGEYVNKNV